MKHRLFGKKLNRNHHQRQALFKNMVRALFTHGSLKTTEAKAKAIIPLAEGLVSSAQKASLADKQRLYRCLQNQAWVNRVIEGIQAAYPNQQSNFIRMTRVIRRLGDNALIAKLSFSKPVSFSPKETQSK